MTPMDCRGARELLHDYLAGETTSEERELVDRHVASCPECGDLFRNWSTFRASVRRAGRDVAIPQHLRATVTDRLREATAPAALSRLRMLSPRVLLPALVALLLIAVALPLALQRPVPTAPDVAGSPVLPSSTVVAVTPHPIRTASGLLASLVGDHRMHGEMVGTPVPAARQDRAIQDFSRRLATRVSVPASLVGGYKRETCMLCPVGSIMVPHVQYRLGTRTVSLFLASAGSAVVDGRKASTLPEGSLYKAAMDRENVLLWRSGKAVYVLVSKEPPATLTQLAATF